VQHVDLDGHVDLASQPVVGGLRVEDACLAVSDAPGLGLELSPEYRERLEQS